MKFKSALLATFITLFTSLSAARADTLGASGTIEVVQVNANGTIRFKLSGSPICTLLPDSKGTAAYGDITVGQAGVTAEAARGMLALLTAARLSQRTVLIYASTTVVAGYGCAVTVVELQ